MRYIRGHQKGRMGGGFRYKESERLGGEGIEHE